MGARIEVTGTADFHRAALALKAAGENKLAREMHKALRKGAGPLVEDAQRRARALPMKAIPERASKKPPAATIRGGSAARLARAQSALGKKKRPSDRLKMRAYAGSGLRDTVARATSAKTSVTARSASLRVRAAQAKMPHDQRRLPRYLNRGQWRHPVFGGDQWVTQKTSPAWFDDAAKAKGPAVRDDAIKTVGEYLDKIV